jgi:hypothetical protein
MMCSSFEETVKTIPDVGSTDEWTTMIIHEYFHGFQYKHKPYMDYYENEIVQIQPDSLTTFYKKLPWFKQSIDAENQLLLDAIAEKDSIQTKKLIQAFGINENKEDGNFNRNINLALTNLKSVMKLWKALPDMLNFRYTRILLIENPMKVC